MQELLRTLDDIGFPFMSTYYSNNAPIIGLTARHGDAEWLEKNTVNYINVLNEHHVQYVILAPDTPARIRSDVVFHPTEDGSLPDELLDSLDGLILSGGGDVHPSEFGQELDGTETDRISLERDRLELGLTRTALYRDMPIFGICRGCQVLNIAAGGRLIQHLDGHRSPEDSTAYHPVKVDAGTRLEEAAHSARINVNTFHHQGVDEANLATGFVASGFAEPDKWLIEGIESPDHTWVLGVQWHPERTFELESAHLRIWESFVSACHQYQKRL